VEEGEEVEAEEEEIEAEHRPEEAEGWRTARTSGRR
jgi:hypothetical protein